MGSSFRTAVEHLPRQRRRDVRARRSAVRDDQRVPDACSTPTASTRRPSSASGTARSWRRRICSSGSSSPSLPGSQHGARPVLQRHVERTTVLQFPAGSADGYRHARGLRAAPRAACPRGGEGWRIEPLRNPPAKPRRIARISPRMDDRDFVRRFRAQREAHRAAHARRLVAGPARSPAAARPASSLSIS